MPTPGQPHPGLTPQQSRLLEIRRRGKARYVGYFGVLRWGILWTLGMGLFTALFGDQMHAPLVSHSVPRVVGWCIFIAPFGLLSGLWYGLWMWRIFDRNTRHLEGPSDRGVAS